jgi:hypothetical protein
MAELTPGHINVVIAVTVMRQSHVKHLKLSSVSVSEFLHSLQSKLDSTKPEESKKLVSETVKLIYIAQKQSEVAMTVDLLKLLYSSKAIDTSKSGFPERG